MTSRLFTVLFVACALSLSISMSSQAEDAAPANRPKMEGARHEEMLKRFDKDGDGQLSETERQAMQEEMKKRKEGETPRPEMLKRFDKDGDGKLSEDERAAAKTAMQEHMKNGGGPEGGRLNPEVVARLKAAADTDGDGVISDEEGAAAKAAIQAIAKERRENPSPEMLKRMDTNGDGTIDQAEREAAREKMKERMNKEGGERPAKPRKEGMPEGSHSQPPVGDGAL